MIILTSSDVVSDVLVIGTGIAGFPSNQCAEIMIDVLQNFLLNEEHNYKEIRIVLFTENDYKVFKEIFTNRFNEFSSQEKI